MSGLQSYTIDEFSGGVTDYYVDGPPNAAMYMENLILNPVRKPTTRYGITYFCDAQVDSSATRMYLINHAEEPLLIQGRKAFYKSGAAAFTQIYGPNNGGATDPAMGDSSVSSGSICSSAFWKGHTFVTTDDIVQPQKFYKDSGGTWYVRNAGLPAPTSLSGVCSVPGSVKSYVYAIVYYYTYTVGNQTFEDRSAPYTVTVTTTNPIGPTVAVPEDSVTLTLPGFSGFGENWQAASVIQEIYRTINNGTDFYRVTTVNYSTLSVVDTTRDITLITSSLPLYTNGGTVDYDMPPKCKFIHVMGNTGYYGYLEDSSGVYPYMLRQSIPNDVDSVPGDFNLELREAITGVSSNNGKPIVMCTNEVVRVEGAFDQFGRGGMSGVQISPNAGCLANNSIVQTPFGLFWFGNDGIYHTEGYAVKKISQHITESYKVITSNATKRKRVAGTYHADLQLVVWTCCRTDAANECDSMLVLDLRWGVRPEALDVKQTPATFYWWSGTTISSVRFIDRQLQLASSTGYLYWMDETLAQDLLFEASGSPSTWDDLAIDWQWTSTASDLGSKEYKKWVPWVAVDCTADTNISIDITSICDNGKKRANLKSIRNRSGIVWGIDDVFWGEAGYKWLSQGTLDAKRRMAAGSLRSMHRQLELSAGYVVITSSTLMGAVNVNSGLLTATLNGTLNWPTQFVGYYISFDNDSYQNEFYIASTSTTTLVVTDPHGWIPATGSYNFVVRGIPKGERLKLNAVQMWYAPVSKTLDAYTTAESGEPS